MACPVWISCRSLLLVLLVNGLVSGQAEDQRLGVGRRFPSERVRYVDEVTGREVTMLTSGPARDNKIYQTHPNWTADGEHVVFTSDRTGSNQYFAVSTTTGVLTQLTDDTGPSQACLSRTRNQMFYVAGRTVWDLDIEAILRASGEGRPEGFRRAVATLPEDTKLSGSISVDSNGKDIYLGVEQDGSWGLMKLDSQSGSLTKIVEVGFRVGHCQAHPSILGLIMYCWETGGDAEQRMWVVRADGSGNGPFYKETYDEWVTHEVWWGSDKALFTIWPKNEEMLKKPHGIAYISLEDRALHILDQRKYWHVGADRAGRRAVGDTFDGELYLVDAQTGQGSLLTQGHRPKGATVHPHPSFSPDDSAVLFCSERNGNWDLCLVDVK